MSKRSIRKKRHRIKTIEIPTEVHFTLTDVKINKEFIEKFLKPKKTKT